jgi:SNF2 family DNA or RNA helicase
VQNDLIELYNLITLLRPGHLKTTRDFKKEFVMSGDIKKPKNKDALRRLLTDVMIRNTRSVVNIGLPKRWAHTFILTPSKEEEELYNKVTEFVKRHIHHKSGTLDRLTLFTLQKEAGSSPQAVGATLERLQSRFFDTGDYAEIQEISHFANTVSSFAKAEKLFNIILENPKEKILVFARYKKTLEFLSSEFAKRHIVFREFHGEMPMRGKDNAIKAFEKDVPILLSTESGGEGRNLQFCNTVINYDLPWNPLRIEQRIGRVHRFGQKREVFIFNLALKNSVEEYILDILDAKLNMFELVIGEMDMILGHLGKGGQNHDFEDMVMSIWTRQSTEEIQRGFAKLGKELVSAKERYGESKELDRALFEEDYQL